MATSTTTHPGDSVVSVKVTFVGKEEHRKLRLTLNDLGPSVLPQKLKELLAIKSEQETVFERYSDSSSSYVILNSENVGVYKQLFRAAKAKGKLKLRVTITDSPKEQASETPETPMPPADRLPSRSYVQPYVTDSTTDQSPSSRISMLEDFKTLSAAPSTITLAPFTKSTIEVPKKESPPSYFWPVSENNAFSDATKTKFEKANAPMCPRKERHMKTENKDEAPVPGFFDFNDEQFLAPTRRTCPVRTSNGGRQGPLDSSLAKLAEVQHRHVTERKAPKLNTHPNFVIQCNKCENPIPDAHWHCSICDNGDYDLCVGCVQKGHLCQSEQHWLIKRFFKDGKIINSTTETMSSGKSSKTVEKKEIPGAFTTEAKTEPVAVPERTCNACVQVFPESKFITCTICDDFDLCMPCHLFVKHGHHPGHLLRPVVNGTVMEGHAKRLLNPGRNYAHFAVCDGCDKNIVGVRHKCLNCPDWDFCSTCAPGAPQTHPGHRFVQLYEPIQHQYQPNQSHHGICCDGPLCQGKPGYIIGDRYKCAVCHDTDFCARCEALPTLKHNRTHPLLKFQTPVRNVSVSTYGEKANGETMRPMGDQSRPTSSKSTETAPPAASANASTQVQRVAEEKPIVPSKESSKPEEEPQKLSTSDSLQAHFVVDSVTDGTVIPPSTQFTQTWTLSNPGPHAWPAGCVVCFVGGDSMLNVDSNHPSSVGQLTKASCTNTVDQEVAKGEKVNFSVTMRTSEREGKAISYWRLKTRDGILFGHRLWCDIDVRQAPEPEKTEEVHQKEEHTKDELEASIKEEEQPRSSHMIFPKLEKESPVSSQHEAEGSPLASVPAAATLSPAEQDLLEDVESLELDDNEDGSSEEGFLTDEEYELIASGDEMEVAKNGKK